MSQPQAPSSSSSVSATQHIPPQQQPLTSTTATPPQQPTPQKAQLDLGIVLLLHKWPALTTAVTSLWGGPDSRDKRAWFAGFLADYLASEPAADAADVETMLLDFLETEFDTRLEDESEVALARDVVGLRDCIARGELRPLDELRDWWERTSSAKGGAAERARIERGVLGAGRAGLPGEDPEAREEEWSDGEEEEDVDMGEAPALVEGSTMQRREKVVPQVDEDGFTTVVSKKRR